MLKIGKINLEQKFVIHHTNSVDSSSGLLRIWKKRTLLVSSRYSLGLPESTFASLFAYLNPSNEARERSFRDEVASTSDIILHGRIIRKGV